jgi:hypothetical protein
MTLNPKYGRIGLLAMPYQWIFEFLAPLAEVLGWMAVAAGAGSHAIGRSFLIMYFLFGYLFSSLLSVGSVLLEEMVYHRYNDWGDLCRLVGVCFLEPVYYRPLNTIWRVQGLWHFVTGRNSWQLIHREGFCQDSATKQRSAPI